MDEKQYLGDSVYARFDGYHIWLTTENGYGPSNEIALEPAVYESLVRYVDALKAEAMTQENSDGGL